MVLMIVLATKHKGNRMWERGYLQGFFSANERTAKMWRQLIEYIHPEGEKALEKYEDLERKRVFGASEGAAKPIVKHDLAEATKLSLWLKIFGEAAASILGITPHKLFTIILLEDVDSHLQPWKHHDEDPLGINWYLIIEEALKESRYTEEYLGRKIAEEELKKLEEVAKVIAKFVDAWGPDNINHAQIWLAEGSNMDDLEEFIKKYAKDPEKAFQYLEELRQVMHKCIKPKGLVDRRQKVESSALLEIRRELQSLKEENKKLQKGNGRAKKGNPRA
ncbi:hypothetical protein [Thermococcus barophilus]|nr:hypothetical protein [Thermococcus barophilus]